MSLIELEGAARTYRMGDAEVRALQPTWLNVEAGEMVVMLGPSGSGKTTMLNLIAGLDSPSEGRVRVAGQDLTGLGRDALTEYRRRHVGVVFQFFNLVPNLTARENVELVAELAGARRRPEDVLAAVGLSERMDHFPHELSGGEQQRVAVARALVKDPPILVGDEPTGNLDVATGRRILRLFQEIHKQGKCVLLVTHNSVLTRVGTRVISLRGGAVQSDVANPDPVDPEDLDW